MNNYEKAYYKEAVEQYLDKAQFEVPASDPIGYDHSSFMKDNSGLKIDRKLKNKELRPEQLMEMYLPTMGEWRDTKVQRIQSVIRKIMHGLDKDAYDDDLYDMYGDTDVLVARRQTNIALKEAEASQKKSNIERQLNVSPGVFNQKYIQKQIISQVNGALNGK